MGLTINGAEQQSFYLDDWFIEPAQCCIVREEESVHLEPKVMDLLVAFVQSPDHVHSRDELLETVWSGMVVSDEALTNAIIKLRKALQDSARNPRYIETLPKRGYRLVAPVRPVDEKGADRPVAMNKETVGEKNESLTQPVQRKSIVLLLSLVLVGLLVLIVLIIRLDITPQQVTSTPDPSALPLPDKPSIAVLPFLNIGNEISDSYFSDGITDDLITDLSKISGLFVISRNSSFRYKGRGVDVGEVAKTLGVRYVLEGSVRRSGERVRVNTQLVDGQTGGQLWAERYDGEMKDVFLLQDRMTAKIISALQLKLSPHDEVQLAKTDTTNPEAYDQFLKGWELRWRVNRESYVRAEQYFKKALELDPKYARANAGLALLYMQIWQKGWHQNSGTRSASWGRARVHLEVAMSNPDSLTHSLRSTLQLHNRRYEKAINEARQAVTLNPSNAEGHLALAEALSFFGESVEAIYHAEKAQRLDPKYPAPYLIVEGRAHFDRKRYRATIGTLEKARRVNPYNTKPLIFQIAAYGQLGETDYAKLVLDQLNTLLKSDHLPNFTLGMLRNRLPYKSQEALQHLKNGLLKGGVPEW